MKIVIISPYQFELRRGIETFVYSLANQLAEDYCIDIIIYAWAVREQIVWKRWHPKIKIRQVPKVRYFQEKLAGFYYYFWLLYDSPDCVILNFLFHGESILPKDKRYIYILNYPASQVPERYKVISKIVKKFKNLTFIAVSEMVKKEALLYLQHKEIKVILNGVDTSYFTPPKHSVSLSKKIRLITLAALEERKGIQFVIKALTLLRHIDISYDIYGDGSYKEELLLLVKKLDLQDIVKLHKTVDDPAQIYKSADIFCLLSKGEGFPFAVLEAMASGLAVIVSQYSPFEELITEDVGIIVERENSIKVAEAINSLLDSNRRRELANNGRRLIEEKFSLKVVASQYYKVIFQQ